MRLLKQVLGYLVLALGSVVMLLPFVWMLSTSLKTKDATFVMPPQFIPADPTFASYQQVFATAPMGQFIFNSLVVAIANTALLVLFSAWPATPSRVSVFADGRCSFMPIWRP